MFRVFALFRAGSDTASVATLSRHASATSVQEITLFRWQVAVRQQGHVATTQVKAISRLAFSDLGMILVAFDLEIRCLFLLGWRGCSEHHLPV
jgi:hypothetical protein